DRQPLPAEQGGGIADTTSNRDHMHARRPVALDDLAEMRDAEQQVREPRLARIGDETGDHALAYLEIEQKDPPSPQAELAREFEGDFRRRRSRLRRRDDQNAVAETLGVVGDGRQPL